MVPPYRTVPEARMGRRSLWTQEEGHWLVSPSLRDAPMLDLMCSHFVLALVVRQGAGFNVRRDFASLLPLVGRHLVWPQSVLMRLREFLAQRCQGNELWRGHESLAPLDFLERFGLWRGPFDEATLYFFLDEYAKEQHKDIMAMLSATQEWLRRAVKRHSTLVERNINALSSLLQLNKAERAILLYGTLARYQRDMRSLLVEFKVNNAPEAFATIAEVAGVSAAQVAEALRTGSRLERIGLVENLISEHNITDLADLMKVSEKLPPVLMRAYRNQAELMAVFTRPCTATALTVEDFGFVQADVDILCNLLTHAVARQEAGVNILLYGPPGTGKTELAKVVAQASDLVLFEVEYADRDGNSLNGRDRYRSLQIAQVFLKGAARSVLLFDEVEDVFPPLSREAARWMSRSDTDADLGSSINGKAWVNQVLEANAVPTIWITNRIEQIDPAFRRRFVYHLELKSPPPGARAELVRKTMGALPVSDVFLERLAQRQGLTPAQIRTAARFAEIAGAARTDEDGSDALESLMERQIRHADHALGNRSQTLTSHHAASANYDLSLLHIRCQFEISRVVQALQLRRHGSLCFYGPPGTGKTALAHHIARALGQPLQMRKASDLLGPYVGETEQRLAAMFHDAESDGAVLLLDEADSFLQDRRGALRNHEVSEVNELLQGMEHFRGVFICTTNLIERLDQASLRRFAFKLEFRPLTSAQRESLFVEQACKGNANLLIPALQNRLQALDHLCLGDFAAVQQQVELLRAALDPAEFLEQLETEHRLKPEVREARSVGFLS